MPHDCYPIAQQHIRRRRKRPPQQQQQQQHDGYTPSAVFPASLILYHLVKLSATHSRPPGGVLSCSTCDRVTDPERVIRSSAGSQSLIMTLMGQLGISGGPPVTLSFKKLSSLPVTKVPLPIDRCTGFRSESGLSRGSLLTERRTSTMTAHFRSRRSYDEMTQVCGH
jgi:hypothetical protein